MSFQGYLDTIKSKTGKSPDDLCAYAAEKGWTNGRLLRPDIKAGAIIADLKEHLGLGHGHAMAVVALLKGKKEDS